MFQGRFQIWEALVPCPGIWWNILAMVSWFVPEFLSMCLIPARTVGSMELCRDHAERMILSIYTEVLPLACVFSGVPPSGKSRSAPPQVWQSICFLYFFKG